MRTRWRWILAVGATALLIAAAFVSRWYYGGGSMRGTLTHQGVIEWIQDDGQGSVSLWVRERPPREGWEKIADERQRGYARIEGIIIVHMLPSTSRHEWPADGPRVGDRVKVWTNEITYATFPGGVDAISIAYQRSE